MSDVAVYALNGVDYTAGVQTCYLLAKDGDAVLIDASCSPGTLFEVLSACGCTLRAILLTHSHFDHCAAAAALQAFAPIYAHPICNDMLSNGTWRAGLPVDVPPVWRPNIYVTDGQTLSIGAFSVRVIYTPGHTADSVCYLIDDAYLAGGDTVMNDMVCGTWQLPTGNAEDLYRSGQKLWSLCPDDAYILGGHVSRPDRAEWAPYTPHSTVRRAKIRNWINR